MAHCPPAIEHRCLEYCYTTFGRSSQIYWQIPPAQENIDALNTATPNLADLCI